MALVGCLVSYTIMDGNGFVDSGNVRCLVDNATTILALQNVLNNFGNLVDAAADGKVIEVRVQFGQVATNAKADPVAGCDLSQTMTMSMANGTPRATPFVVPALAESVIVNGAININDTKVTDLVTWLTTAHTTLQATSEEGGALLTDMNSALLSFPERRSKTSRRTVKP